MPSMLLRIIRTCASIMEAISPESSSLSVNISSLTEMVSFSTENWNRPSNEVAALMALLFDSIEEETFMKNNISFRVIGDLTKLPDNVRERLETCIAHTANNTGMSLVLAISYSSRWEITAAARRLAVLVQKGELTPEQIDSTLLSQYLATDFMPDPDLLIRTGGEIRLSNYLLWQCAYSELYFCDTYWPDFREAELHKAIHDYQKRERRFGKTSEQIR